MLEKMTFANICYAQILKFMNITFFEQIVFKKKKVIEFTLLYFHKCVIIHPVYK